MKDDFMQYFNDRAIRSDNAVFVQNKSKFVKAHTTSGHKHAIDEIFLDPAVSSRLGEVKAVQEVRQMEFAYILICVPFSYMCVWAGLAQVRAMGRFHSMLGSDADRASYGYNEVIPSE